MSKQAEQAPTVGRIVHWVAGNSEHMAAIVTYVHEDGLVNMQVFEDYGSHGVGRRAKDVRYSDAPDPYTWHWPEREP
jgi:hypothetical protein